MAEGTVTVRMFGLLHTWRRERGLPDSAQVDLPAEGVSAHRIAEELGLPIEMIEAVFIDHVIHPLCDTVLPGQRVAFLPYGTPGPHRFMLGIYNAGKHRDDEPGA